jgi:hypothetical protein
MWCISLLFQCIVSILWVLITVSCRNLKCNTLFTNCACYSWEMAINVNMQDGKGTRQKGGGGSEWYESLYMRWRDFVTLVRDIPPRTYWRTPDVLLYRLGMRFECSFQIFLFRLLNFNFLIWASFITVILKRQENISRGKAITLLVKQKFESYSIRPRCTSNFTLHLVT